jgi:ribosomal protein S12 methylthiotransferase accessory factor
MPNFNQLNKSLVKQTFFDATSDFGIPTVYTVQCLDGHPNMSQYVNCATEFNAVSACAKTIREAAPARFVFNNGIEYPQNVDDFISLHDGASYLGRPEKRQEFDFLLNSDKNIQLNDIASWKEECDKQKLKKVLEIFRSKNMNIVAVDLTTDELRELGIWVIRVVIPGLMPMSPVHRARFLGHPRLYSYPESMGFGSLCEDDINPAPQPFA